MIKPKCKYCHLELDTLRTSNHILGCNIESIAQILRFRGYEQEANDLDKIASRIK
jgi:hypothetical protein